MIKITKLTTAVAMLVLGISAFVWALINYLGDDNEYVAFYEDDEW